MNNFARIMQIICHHQRPSLLPTIFGWAFGLISGASAFLTDFLKRRIFSIRRILFFKEQLPNGPQPSCPGNLLVRF
ncbi:hypothetical protein B5X24_HaOG207137 [Helicoverpa armigera]|uniref:Uncharacterized protein n=1 Tax=Helicoverpa armigera TaxID=29058 RepID=A0A2W1BMI1_HELAM|nr:hypothetical protein B5X24_HaOG207137 [Helicoverpa armigera]